MYCMTPHSRASLPLRKVVQASMLSADPGTVVAVSQHRTGKQRPAPAGQPILPAPRDETWMYCDTPQASAALIRLIAPSPSMRLGRPQLSSSASAAPMACTTCGSAALSRCSSCLDHVSFQPVSLPCTMP